MTKSPALILALVLGASSILKADDLNSGARPADALHEGFVKQPLKIEVQHPYDLPLAQRYSYDKATDTHDLWVLATDKAHLPPPNKTENNLREP